MANDAVPQTPAAVEPLPSREEYEGMLSNVLDTHEDIRQEFQATKQVQDEENGAVVQPQTEQPGFWSSIWDRFLHGPVEGREERRKQSPMEKVVAEQELIQDTGKSVVKGAVRGVSTAASGLGELLSAPDRLAQKAAGSQQALGTDKSLDFVKWMEKTQQETNVFDVGNAQVQKWLGPQAGGGLGFVEGMSQFASGFAMTASLLKGLPAASALNKGKVIQNALTGAITDFSFFDPHQERLSNVLQQYGYDNPVTAFLAADPDDGEAEGRLKNALEGFLIGGTVDILLAGLKASRALLGLKSGKLSEKAAEKIINKELEAAAAAQAKEGPGFGVVEDKARQKYVLVAEDELPGVPPPEAGPPKDLEAPHTQETPNVPQTAEDKANWEATKRKLEQRVNPEVTPLETEGAAAKKPQPAPSGASKKVVAEFANAADAQNAAVSMSMASKNARTPAGAVDDQTVAAFKELLINYDGVKDSPQLAGELLERYGFNVNYHQQPQQIVNVVKALVDAAGEAQVVARGKVRTWKETAKAAKQIFGNLSEDEAVQAGAKLFGDTQNLDAYLQGLKAWQWAQARKVHQLSLLAELQPSNAIAHQELAKGLDSMLELHAYATGTGSNVARAQNAQKIGLGEAAEAIFEKQEKRAAEAAEEAAAESVQVRSKDELPKTPAEVAKDNVVKAPMEHRAPPTFNSTKDLTRKELRALARSIFLSEGDPAKILAALRAPKMTKEVAEKAPQAFKKKLTDAILTYRMEAMLSGPKTHLTNMISNMTVMFQRPAEYFWAGVPTPWRSGNKQLRQMGADMMLGLFENWRESMSTARKAFLVGKNILDADAAVADVASQAGLGEWSHTRWPAKIFRAPSRLLMTSDEFFKNMNYRANMRAQILRDARAKGVVDPDQLAQRLTEDMKLAVAPDGSAVNPVALQYSRVGTFTNDLAIDGVKESMGEWLQKGAQNSPWFRVVMPFVRTPVNIFRYQWERTPLLNMFNKTHAADIAAGGERKAIAQAKTEMGVATWGLAASLVAGGYITGRGPSDPALRKEWLQRNQPYSFRIPGTDKWVSFRRGDPTGTAFGLVADTVNMWGELEDGQRDNLAAAFIASVAANVTSKTFMQGVSDFFEMMSSGRADMVANFAENVAGSFVPNFFNQTNPDTALHETRGMVDEIAARIPGWSTSLETRRNIFGEKVLMPPVSLSGQGVLNYLNKALNPFTVFSPGKKQNVLDELIGLGKALPMPDTKKEDGFIDLTDRKLFNDGKVKGQSPYDRMLEIQGEGPGGMDPLRTAVENIVEGDSYQESSREQRLFVIKKILKVYQDAAWAQVQDEYPSVQAAVEQAKQLRNAARSGDEAGTKELINAYGDQLKIRPKAIPALPKGTQQYRLTPLNELPSTPPDQRGPTPRDKPGLDPT